jgi:peptidoglycan/LPS O-acetylase OafA/YrhL
MWLGRVSFSFYLIHLIPLEVFEYLSQVSFGADRPAVAVMFVAALALPFVLAALLHRFAEVPLQKLGRTLSARPGRCAAPTKRSARPLERSSGSAL